MTALGLLSKGLIPSRCETSVHTPAVCLWNIRPPLQGVRTTKLNRKTLIRGSPPHKYYSYPWALGEAVLKLEKALGTSVHRDVDKRSDPVALEETKSGFVRYASRGIINLLQASAYRVTV